MTVQDSMINALTRAFSPEMVSVENESHMHNVPADSETHFKVTLVSDMFETQTRVRRHQSVYAVLKDWLSGPVHALALHTFTPAEWILKEQVPDSPACKGGAGR